jgi:nucleotide-binding universal stress UspA family protein
MTRPILVGFDPRNADHAPVRFGAMVARMTRAPLMIVSVQAGPLLAETGAVGVAPLPLASVQEEAGPHVALPPSAQVHEQLVEDCTAAMEEIEAEVRAWGLMVDCVKLRSTSAARALHEAAEREEAGLLVVGSSLHEGRLLGGTTAEHLMSGSPCAVGVVPPSWTADRGVHMIGVGYTPGEEAREALRSAAALARRADATLRVITVVKAGADRSEEPDKRNAGQEIRQAVAELANDVAVEIDVRAGDAAETLIALSDDLDLLVCGSRGYGPLRAALLGSVTQRVTAEARCPVIVLPRGVKHSLETLLADTPGAAAQA